MKNNRLINLLSILIITVSIISCTNDSDEENTSSNTFLERFNNTTWEYTYEKDLGGGEIYYITNYIKFNNNEANPIDEWEFYSYQSDCWEHYNYASWFEIEVIENSKERFVIKVIRSSETNWTHTFSVSGESILVNTITNDGSSTFDNTVSLLRSNDDVESLKICD